MRNRRWTESTGLTEYEQRRNIVRSKRVGKRTMIDETTASRGRLDAGKLTIVRGERRVGETVELDGHHFEACRFEACELLFVGEQPFSYTATELIDCSFRLEGAAQMVLSVLGRTLADADLLGLVAQLRRPDVTVN